MKKYKKFHGDENLRKFEKAHARTMVCAKKLEEKSSSVLQTLEDEIVYALQQQESVIKKLTSTQIGYLKQNGYTVTSNGNTCVITY